MAWNPNEEGNPAWLTKQASEHGGVDNFINDIRNEGYEDGHEKGTIEGAVITALAFGAFCGARKGIMYLVNKHKQKKQTAQEKAREAEIALRAICEDVDEYDTD